MKGPYDFNWTMALGERSMDFLKKYRTPAVPRYYELSYTFASGYNKGLNDAIHAVLRRQTRITAEDAEQLYDTFLSPIRHCNQMGETSQSLIDEIGEILETAHSSTNSTSAFSSALEAIDGQLPRVERGEQLKTVLQTVIAVTKQMAANNQNLDECLNRSRQQIENLQRRLELVRVEANTDPLTGIANRKSFDRALQQAMEVALETAQPLCLLMIDIDHFKAFNDTFGHVAGDSVLRLVAGTMTKNVKGRDLVARYGGEEFAVILPMTPLEAAVCVANQIREAVMAKELVAHKTGKRLGRIHLSLGVACFRRGETREALIDRADTCLFAAKRRGRNRAVSEREMDDGRLARNASAA